MAFKTAHHKLTILYGLSALALLWGAFAFPQHRILYDLAVVVTLPWSFAHGLFAWSAMHGLEGELIGYLLVCLTANGTLVFVLESRWMRARRDRRHQ